MSDAFDTVVTAVTEARRTSNAVDRYVGQMAELCAGRLQKSGAGHYTLKKLKDELRRYNPHTNTWRDAT